VKNEHFLQVLVETSLATCFTGAAVRQGDVIGAVERDEKKKRKVAKHYTTIPSALCDGLARHLVGFHVDRIDEVANLSPRGCCREGAALLPSVGGGFDPTSSMTHVVCPDGMEIMTSQSSDNWQHSTSPHGLSAVDSQL
jgi:hypothetical protein